MNEPSALSNQRLIQTLPSGVPGGERNSLKATTGSVRGQAKSQNIVCRRVPIGRAVASYFD